MSRFAIETICVDYYSVRATGSKPDLNSGDLTTRCEIISYLHIKPYSSDGALDEHKYSLRYSCLSLRAHAIASLSATSVVSMRAYKVVIMVIFGLPDTLSLAVPTRSPAIVRRKDSCTNAPTVIAGR